MTKTCTYILASGGSCGEKVRYRVVKDDDGNPVRRYDSFCAKHIAKLEEKVRVIRDTRDASQDYFITRGEAENREDLVWSVTNKCYEEAP